MSTDDASTVASVVRGQARRRRDHPLLICDDDRITYAQVERGSALLARGLIALGAGKGTRVGLMYPNGSAFVVAMLAAARLGAVVVPFPTFATARELAEQLRDSDVAIVLAAASYRSHDYVRRMTEVLGPDIDSTEPLYRPAAPGLRHIGFSHDPDRAAQPRDISNIYQLGETVDEALLEAMEREVDGSDTLAVVYTSGSTGAPKGAVHTHAGLLGHQRNLNKVRSLGADDRLFCNSPFFWIGGLAFGLLATLLAGATLICSNATDAGATLDLLEAEKPTITNGFAAGIAHLARHATFADRDLSSMRRGNLHPIMPAELRPSDPELRHNMLGMTEAGSVVLLSADESDQPEHRRGSFGKPAPGFEILIADPATDERVAVGDIGELRIRGRSLMQGYHKRSREDCFDADGWFHTGDLARVDDEGFVYFLGRRGSMIKTAGANVSPAEVEKAIATVTGGTVAHVLGLPDAERGELVAAVVTVADGDAFDEELVRTRLKAELSAYKIPRRFAAVTATQIPLLSSGKVDVRRLKELFDV